jgi:hypothetical protein
MGSRCELGDAARARWWSKSKRTEVVHLRARVILAIWQAAAENGIDLPFSTQRILFHDQTEDSDGDRTRQRGLACRCYPTYGSPALASRSRGMMPDTVIRSKAG